MLIFDSSLDIQAALKAYDVAWKALSQNMGSPKFEERLVATTLSVKVADKATLFKLLQDNAEHVEQVHVGTVNGRYIASATLHRPFVGMPILKVLERRAGSNDPLGLDSIDYLVSNLEGIFQELKAAGLNVIKEHNDMHAWLSLRFGANQEFEAKITNHLVLDVAIKELKLANNDILSKLSIKNRR